jgi:mRNA interferase RelE/StbE
MYVVRITPLAERLIERLNRQTSRKDFYRIRDAIKNLSTEPYPQGVRKIIGRESSFRIRVGRFRVVYEVMKKENLVLITKVSRRKESTYDL